MAETQLQLVEITELETNSKENSIDQPSCVDRTRKTPSRDYKWWIRTVLYTVFLICGQSLATLLGRLYFDKGGTSKWLASLAQIGGFPVLVPLYFFILCRNPTLESDSPPFVTAFLKVYVPLGLLVAGSGYLFSVGLQYLPVSTVTLITASQLAFNAFFSYFLNSQKFTASIVNSLVLLTISSVLLVVNNHTEKPAGVSKGEYAAGFICTVGGAAVYGLMLASQQLALRKVLKIQTLKVVFDVIIYQSLVASMATVVGLFASGEYKGLKKEMEEYALGKVSYAMTLLWTAIGWQVFAIGTVGLVFEVSSLYSISVRTVGLPIVPVLAVFVFHDKMDGIKGMSMVLAIWGFVSYIYQHNLDHQKSKIENRIVSEIADEDWSPADNRA
ncbi:putative purine permease 10 [Hibiscus syriacus]|uniref:Probable purine permease n=1 Tax=Hibiscus syriacus TaxID=106335 RepID=A0A6A3C1V8_HIBSY|nr:purine permease 21-like [Hibiscus syriacus]KAE8722963.1 putative purine permease 10 [Hibiscus syriacus]